MFLKPLVSVVNCWWLFITVALFDEAELSWNPSEELSSGLVVTSESEKLDSASDLISLFVWFALLPPPFRSWISCLELFFVLFVLTGFVFFIRFSSIFLLFTVRSSSDMINSFFIPISRHFLSLHFWQNLRVTASILQLFSNGQRNSWDKVIVSI